MLPDAVRSVLHEPTGIVAELLLVDDTSTNPDTPAVLSDLRGSHACGCCMVVRTDIAHKIGVFSKTGLYGGDWLLCVCTSTVTDLYHVQTPSYTLRPFCRELRWALHSAWKGLAADNLLRLPPDGQW